MLIFRLLWFFNCCNRYGLNWNITFASDFKKIILLYFRRYRVVALLFLFVSLSHLNGFSCQHEILSCDDIQWASDSYFIADVVFFDTNEMPASFLRGNFRNGLIAIERSCLCQLNFITVAKRRTLKIADNKLNKSTAFRNFNFIPLAASRPFAPGSERLLALCVFRLWSIRCRFNTIL